MGEIVTIGLDLAKNVFQVHGVDSSGAAVLKKALRRAQVLAFFRDLPSCLIGMEACATAHHWARELTAGLPGLLVVPDGSSRIDTIAAEQP